MKKVLIFCIFAILFGCYTEKIIPSKCKPLINISDGNPVQFWLNGCKTFNEKNIPGVFSKCFCQPFNCSDNIKVQFTDTSARNYFLYVSDEGGIILSIAFNRTTLPSGEYLYEASFIPKDHPDITFSSDVIYFNSQFTTSLDGWQDVNSVTLTDDWFWDSPSQSASRLQRTQDSIAILAYNFDDTHPFSQPIHTGDVVRIRASFSINSFLDCDMNIRLRAQPSKFYSVGTFSVVSGVIDFEFTAPQYLGADIDWTDIDFSITGGMDPSSQVYVDYFILSGSPGGVVKSICDTQLSLSIGTSVTSIVAKSDCIEIAESHDETILINYSNHRNYAGLNYSDISPDPDFNIRVPCVFFEPSFPQEQEVIELSDSRFIQLNSELTEKRLLQVKSVPPYFHKKLLLALTHQFVLIDDSYWIKNDSYDIVAGNKKYPLKQALCYLTKKNDIQRNIL